MVAGRIALVEGKGKRVKRRIVDRERLRCSQQRSRRNHHCVLVFPPKRSRVPDECEGCSLELLLEARHPRAKPGNKLVIGADAPGRIEGDRGRLNVAVIGRDEPKPTVMASGRPLKRKVPVASRSGGRGPRQVIHSVRLDDLQKHEQVFVEARGLLRTSHLPYGTFIGSQVILAERPDAIAAGEEVGVAATLHGEITEKNGFNCTRAPSAHSNPCLSHKVGFVRMKRHAESPLYLNFVVGLGARFGGRWHPGDKAKVLRRGGIRAWRYGPEGWAEIVFG
jgi:hypothetical protein